MNFTNRLIPFLNKDAFHDNLLTAFWVIVLLIIFLIALSYLLISFFRIKKEIELDNLPKSKKLQKFWEAYQGTFSNYGNSRKTTEFSEEYFNEHNILFASLNLRAINNVSNTLIGLGILGTFVGLTYGIADSNFESTEEIKQSINNLLSGMGTAFVSSIWGMGLSLIFSNVFKIWQSQITRNVQKLCLSLNDVFKIKQHDLELHLQENQRKLLSNVFNEYLVAETEEGKLLPKNIFRQLLEESVKQTASLQTFSDDLGMSIELAMEKLMTGNSQQLNTLIEEKLVPVLKDLKHIQQDSSSQIVENTANRLATSMKLMMDDFKGAITEETKKEMEALLERLSIVSKSLIGIPNSMSNITTQVAETMNTMKESVIENINESKMQSQEINKQNIEAFSVATMEYKASISNLQTHMESILSTQKDNITQVSELTNEIRTILTDNGKLNEQYEAVLDKSKTVAELIETISLKFETNSTVLTEASHTLHSSTSEFRESINEYINKNESLLNHQAETLESTNAMANEYVNKFEIIEKGLGGIFGQIQTGLQEYQKISAENLNQYLTQFSTTLTTAHEGLASTVSGLVEINEELTEQIDKLIKTK